MNKRDRRLNLAIGIVAGTLLTTGCSGPLRVEWGFKGDPKQESGEEPAPLGRNGQWAAWQSLHDQLVRRIRERRYGDAVPKQTLEASAGALKQLASGYPDPAGFEALRQLYEELDQTRTLGSTSLHAKKLERAAKALIATYR